MNIDVMQLPNVRVGSRILVNYPRDITVFKLTSHEVFHSTMTAVIPKYPQWDFEFFNGGVSRDHGPPDGKRVFSLDRVKVYAGQELLGIVGIEYHGANRKVYVHNHRIAEGRSRNNGKAFTSDAKRAVSMIDKQFSRKTPSELLKDAVTEISGVFQAIMATAQYELRQKQQVMYTLAGTFLHDNYSDPMLAHLLQSSESTQLIDSIKEVKDLSDKSTTVMTMHSKFSNHKAIIVVVLPDSYVVHSNDANDTLSSYTHDTLPKELRGPLGLLKLTEAKTVIDVGVRISDTVFCICMGDSDAA